MREQKQNGVVHVLPSLTDIAFLVPVLFLFGELNGARTMLGDGDTGWHVRTGEWILAHGRVPRQDMFSFTMPGQPWFAWEWLWDVAAAGLHRWGGMAAVVLASTVVIALSFALLYRVTRRHCRNPLIAIAVTVLAAASSTIHWLARPHLLSLLLLVLFYDILNRLATSTEATRRRLAYFLLPALTLVWTNLHGGFLAGIAMVLIFAAAEFAPAWWSADRAQGREKVHLGHLYLASAGGCVLASLANPYFYHLHVHIFRYLTDSYQFDHISEFLSLNFHHPAARYLEPMLLLGAIAAYVQFRKGRVADTLLIAAWGHMALVSARNIPIFVMLAAPAVASMLEEWLEALAHAPVAQWLSRAAVRWQTFAGETARNDDVWRVHAVSAAVVLGLAAGLYAPDPAPNFRAQYDPKVYPAKALEHLGPAPSSRVFTHDEWGDYLIYRLYPATRVFLDGRSDFYGRTFAEKYLDVMNAKPGWEATLARYRIDTILLPPDVPLTGVLKESRRWHIDYDDGVALVFRAGREVQPGSPQISAAHKDGGETRDCKIAHTTM